MASFRGRPLTHETAEDIFISWLSTIRAWGSGAEN